MSAVRSPHDRAGIGELLARELGYGTLDASTITVAPARITHYSTIFRATVPGLASDLAVKCLVHPETREPDALAARRQYEALDRVHRAMAAKPHYRVPRPYFLAQSAGVVAVEWIPGRPMTELLLSWRLSVDEARDLMQRAALWLRCFSSSNPMPAGALNVADKLRNVAEMERGALLPGRTAREAFTALRTHAAAVGEYPLERSWLHGDFKTDNLLIDGARTIGIDMHVQYENTVTHDLAAFLNHWELTLCHPRAWRWRPWRKELAQIFLENFDRDYLDSERLPFLWTALHVMLGNWYEFAERKRTTLQHAYLERCFGALVRRMTRELHQAARQAAA